MKKVSISAIIVMFAASFSYAQYKRTPEYAAKETHTDRGMQIASDLVRERSSLAKKYIRPKSKVTADTAQKICMAVAEEAKKIAKENDIFIIRFVAEKYKNPENVPYGEIDRDEKTGLDMLDKKRQEGEYWSAAKINNESYYIYMKPVFAEKPCLACHGEKEKIPAFIKQKYPEDKSFGFEEGDMMGAVAVYTWKGW